MTISHIRMVEELAANAWRPEIEQHLGGWRLRYSGGNSRRVNSVWPNASLKHISTQEGLKIAEEFYLRRSAAPCFQLCPVVVPTNLHQILADRGYIFYAYTMVQTHSISKLLEGSRISKYIQAPEVKLITSPDVTGEWFQIYTSASGYAPDSLPIRHGILSRIGPAANFIWLENNGVPAATGLGVVERGWLGVFCMVTSRSFKRMGFATAIMQNLAKWGLEQGAENVYLQVMEDNAPALTLYHKLGFRRFYQYYYALKDVKDEKNG